MSQPEKRFRCGPVSASIWAEGKTVDGEMVKFYSINIDKAYKDGDEWKETPGFGRDDLLLLAKAVDEAHTWIYAQKEA